MKNIPKRNDPCHCGSGKKYKSCHGSSNPKAFKVQLLLGVFILTALWYFFYEPEPKNINTPIKKHSAPEGKVWSEEHQHWHDAPSPALPTQTKVVPKNKTNNRPQGGAPPGKVWSIEHQHWHDKK